ncbi:ABC-F family ATP-binding cassette domain-containing protein [Desulfolucanica intricata]|uniref:ABC-F family ATP-binding cassette domain-containing protein n=1 Tax=Desulfolucanica intricata TaxID=1285191 RepID=UPI000834C99F|nr:ABC-F family ATP-binding cassette domain-containing protein [Desulfolucanica intricata]
MILLQASHISKSFGTDKVLDNVNLAVQEKQRVGLVGPNGAGKSTLLKILTGSLQADTGEIIKPKDVSLGYLSQDSGLNSNLNIWDEMLTVFKEVIAQEKALRELEKKMGAHTGLTVNSSERNKLMEEYANLSEDFRNKGGYGYQAVIRGVLHGLKFKEKAYDTVINTLSGGQKTRLALGKLLLARPDVLILDEPTNYLDIETMSWLEQYLQSYRGAILVVSHDRYFLDALVEVIYELERGRAARYKGNYSQFIQLKTAQVEQKLKQYKKQQEEIARTEEFINRNIVRASTTKRAQSRRKMLEKMELLEKPIAQKTTRFTFTISCENGTEVLKVKNLLIGYDKVPLTGEINFTLERGERAAIVGPNGIGKTTLLKTLTGKLKAIKGTFVTGTNVKLGYYEQEQVKVAGTKQVLYELWDEYPQLDEKDVRTVLGNFLFSGDDVYKNAYELSGGERARLSLAKLMLKKANFLLLDEPTNHLDIYSKEVLEDALIDYPGTLLFISHDRYFLNKIATRVLEFTPDGIRSYPGNYTYFLHKKKELKPASGLQEKAGTGEDFKETARENYRQQKDAKRQEERRLRKLRELEKSIIELEAKIAGLEEEIFLPEVNKNLDLLLEKNKELENSKSTLEVYYEEWMELQEIR